MQRMGGSIEVDADDSSDEEDSKQALVVNNYYDCGDKHTIFNLIKDEDTGKTFFPIFCFSLQLLNASEVRTKYYEKKTSLPSSLSVGQSELNALENLCIEIIGCALKKSIAVDGQKEPIEKLVATFLKDRREEIIALINQYWLGDHLRTFLHSVRPSHGPEVTDREEVMHCKTAVQKEIQHMFCAYVKGVELETNPTQSFKKTTFVTDIKARLDDFYIKHGLMFENKKFKNKPDRAEATTKLTGSEHYVFRLLAAYANTFYGRNYLRVGDRGVSKVVSLDKKLVDFKGGIIGHLISYELKDDQSLIEPDESLIEPARGYATRQSEYRVTSLYLEHKEVKIHENPLLYCIFQSDNFRTYDVINEQILKNKIIDSLALTSKDDESVVRFTILLSEELRARGEQIRACCQFSRGLPVQMINQISHSAAELIANLRLMMRIQKRRILQKASLMMGNKQTFFASWAFYEQEHQALEMQELSTANSRVDKVVNLAKYTEIYGRLKQFKSKINVERNSKHKIGDEIIADWIRDIINRGEPKTCYKRTKEMPQYAFSDIPALYRQEFLDFLIELTYLLFGCEAQRNPMVLITHQMALDLISEKKLDWKQAICRTSVGDHDGGGLLAMSMTDSPVGIVRAIQCHLNDFVSRGYYYPGTKMKGQSNLLKVFIQRDSELVRRWLELKGKESGELAETVTAAMTKWYPSITFEPPALPVAIADKPSVSEETDFSDDSEDEDYFPNTPIPGSSGYDG